MNAEPASTIENETLSAFLAAHGVETREVGDELELSSGPGFIAAVAYDLSGVHEHASLQLDVVFRPWAGFRIVESFGGVGATRAERLKDAWRKFAENTLHVLLHVFCGRPDEAQVRAFALTNQGVERKVFQGGALFVNHGNECRYVDWNDAFERLLAETPLPTGTHWVRLYVAQLDGRNLTVELLLDNEPWEAALPAARRIAWPKSKGFVSLRMFLVLQGGLDVRRAAGLIARHRQAEDEELERLLVETGLSALDAKRCVLLIPAAFGRHVLTALGATVLERTRLQSQTTAQDVRLADSPIFAAALKLADEAVPSGAMSKDEVLAVAQRDSGIRALEDLVSKGGDPKNATVATVVQWDESEPLVVPLPGAATPCGKPWWRFW